MAEEEPQPLSYGHETVLKKRKNNEECYQGEGAIGSTKEKKQRELETRHQRPEDFVKEYRDKASIILPQELDHIRMKQRLKLRNLPYDNLKSELLFVTHIRGYPNLKSLRELVYKKGCGMIDKQRVPLTNNNVIDMAPGEYGIICIEDILHEIATVGSHFKEVTKFLWPFKLKALERRLLLKKKLCKDRGDSGNFEEHINDLMNKFN